ncbi:MAG: DUF5060 domain-containing protein [Propionicimonas sp.]
MTAGRPPIVELTFTGPAEPADPAPFTVSFRSDGAQVTVPGFWDGGTCYRVRFDPPLPGRWVWCSSSSDEPTLDGVSGELDVD